MIRSSQKKRSGCSLGSFTRTNDKSSIVSFCFVDLPLSSLEESFDLGLASLGLLSKCLISTSPSFSLQSYIPPSKSYFHQSGSVELQRSGQYYQTLSP